MFPSVKEQLPKAHFFLQVQENRTELGVAIVDFGSDARRIVRRTVDLLNRFLEHGWFDEFLAAGAFGVTYLTLTEGKCLAIAKHFERDCERRLTLAMNRISRTANFQADYLVVPGLVDLLTT